MCGHIEDVMKTLISTQLDYYCALYYLYHYYHKYTHISLYSLFIFIAMIIRSLEAFSKKCGFLGSDSDHNLELCGATLSVVTLSSVPSEDCSFTDGRKVQFGTLEQPSLCHSVPPSHNAKQNNTEFLMLFLCFDT